MRIDAEMTVEAAVLGGEHRVDEIRRQHVEPHMAAAQAPLGEHGAVGGEHGDVWRPVVERGEDRVGQARDEIGDSGAEHDASAERREQRSSGRAVSK